MGRPKKNGEPAAKPVKKIQGAENVEPSPNVEPEQNSGDHESDIQQHPKFDKFKVKGKI